jgi:hypothetical protein
MEALMILVTGLVDWITQHWFLTFLIAWSFKGIHLHFSNLKKGNKEGVHNV